MRLLMLSLVISAASSACKSLPPSVTYYDYNRDGRVDYELHQPRGKGFDALEWARVDDNYDGFYDRQLGFGAHIAVVDHIHTPVPNIEFTEPSPSPSPSPRRQI